MCTVFIRLDSTMTWHVQFPRGSDASLSILDQWILPKHFQVAYYTAIAFPNVHFWPLMSVVSAWIINRNVSSSLSILRKALGNRNILTLSKYCWVNMNLYSASHNTRCFKAAKRKTFCMRIKFLYILIYPTLYKELTDNIVTLNQAVKYCLKYKKD